MKALPLFPALLLTAALPVAAGGPPPETAARLREALRSLSEEGPSGSYTMTTRSLVTKPDGSDREEGRTVVEIARLADGSRRVTVREAVTNGKDETAKRQQEIDRDRAERDKAKATAKKDEDEQGVSLGLPIGDDAVKYDFAAVTGEGTLAVASFVPAAAHAKDDGVTRGRLAWHRDSLDPAWLEARPVDLPTGVSEMTMRIEFARAGDVVYPCLTVTDGLGGVLWIKRRFHVEVEIGEITPQPTEASR